jgi:hypothetical protein
MVFSQRIGLMGVGIQAGGAMMLGGVVQMLSHSQLAWHEKNPLTIKRPTPLGRDEHCLSGIPSPFALWQTPNWRRHYICRYLRRRPAIILFSKPSNSGHLAVAFFMGVIWQIT